ncbi:MAG: ribosome maturation factor RimM [Zoogloeaceae bacterium]|jgi:16S rRNA processing protein RimM|nr:ribosome maturation factor RimM [Zoogloeaceae bacterium]
MPLDAEADILFPARITGAYGVKGWVKVRVFGDELESWRHIPVWHLTKTEDGPRQSREVAECKKHGDGLVVRFADVTDRSAAESLRGFWIGVPRSALPPPAENEFYWDDLIGLTVQNSAGETLGVVEGLLETGAHDVLRVVQATAGGETERLLPFVDAVVQHVDLEKRQMLVVWELDW